MRQGPLQPLSGSRTARRPSRPPSARFAHTGLLALAIGRIAVSDVSPQEVGGTRAAQEVADLLARQGQAILLPAPKGKIKRSIERTDATHRFESGDSRALLFELPTSRAPVTVEITSFCNCTGPSKSIFVPNITVHDATFNQQLALGDEAFSAKAGSLTAKIPLDQSGGVNRYVLLFTRGDLINKELGTLRTFEGLLMKISYPYFRAAFGTVEVAISPTPNK